MSAPAWLLWRSLPAGHALVALGSNLGEREAHLDHALAALAALPGTRLLARSCWHATAPVGGPDGQGEFLNGVVLLQTPLGPEQLLTELHRIEAERARERVVVDGPRTLDLDLLQHGSERRTGPGLVLPHPRMAAREFVLAPLAELCPELELDMQAPAQPGAKTTVRGRLEALRSAQSKL